MPQSDPKTILARAREIARDVVAPRAEEVDRDARWPEEGLRALQQAGLGGLVAPERCGGLGHGLAVLAQVCEVLGRECASTGLCFGMHCVGTAVIAAKATRAQEHTLAAIARGEHLTTLALSEPGTGAHFYYPETRLRADGEIGFRIDGVKSFVTNAGHADSYVVSTAAATPGASPSDFSCVVVSADASGLSLGPAWQGLGMRGNCSRNLELRDVRVPPEALLGEAGDQIWYVFHVVAPFFLTAMAGTYVGIAASALDQAQRHLEKRTYSRSGAGLGQIAVLQHRLGAMWGVVQRTRQLVLHAGQQGDADAPEALPALCSAKAEVADCVVDVVNEAMTLCGGDGYREGGRLERSLRDARAAHVMAPTTDILRTWAGRALLGQPLLAE